ncbi:General secretion pathway protein E [Waddlia chondrophila 2032/99]|uniref:protein-secreting ATPase n=2 Tax=Waddlia chondrophila TaxID=71667 RepID=D6YT55_WADCW|nr:type II secretion system ATPase GspE [Waddlia chondrophila]ADI39250.1 General secretion pathway protein E [Waddlia chondrophila WSU 86-1044]CCB91640.1 General secretion pathway protein E [Waddlia chondrophila 2032/99]
MADNEASDEDQTLRRVLGGEDVNRSMAEQFGMEIYDDLTGYYAPSEVFKMLPYSFVKKHTLLPIKEEENLIVVAVSDPLNLDPLEEIRMLLGREVKAVYSPREMIELAIGERYDAETGAASEFIASLAKGREEGKDDEVEVYDLFDTSREQSPIIKLLNLILTEAIQQGASDIHFEPQESGLRVRYRIDGVLQTRHSPSPELQAQLLARIKVMAKMDIAEHRLPQDGRIKLRMGRREIDFRVSTVPITGGERIVLRILDKGNVVIGLYSLGMLPEVFDEFKRMIKLPEGILLVTGPTGSGKTTTLYSAINEIYSDETNIMTIEDPVEYNLKGIAQIGVKPKINLTFAAGLRTILRQDPDVVMVGEIRDLETAQIAIQASLTGHLVMSTLHTNDAPSAITRLVDMGIEPYLLSSTIVGVLAQRLVRRICPDCSTAYKASDDEIKSLGLARSDLNNGQLFKGEGCKECFGSGYRGRHGIYEMMVINNPIKKQIVKSPDAVELRKIALESGMSSLLSHGSHLAAAGVTTIAEVLRVTRGFEEVE